MHKYTPICAAHHIRLGIRCKQCGDYRYCKDSYKLADKHQDSLGDRLAQIARRRYGI